MLERWIASDLPDEEDSRRARVLNALALFSFVGWGGGSLVGLLGWLGSQLEPAGILAVTGVLVAGSMGGVYALSRRGRLRAAAGAFQAVYSLLVVAMLLALGYGSAAPVFISIIILSGAVLMRRGAAFIFAASLGIAYLVLALTELGGGWQPWLLSSGRSFPPELLIVGQLLGIGAMAFLAWLSSGSLVDAIAAARRNLDRAQQREKELEQARNNLEEQVRERTRDLERALEEVRQRAEEQRTLLDLFRRQTIPVVPLFRRVIAMSAVGVLDAERADRLLSSLLGGVQQYDAQIVLLDVTGLSVVDEAAAQALAQAIAGARLVGAECVLVGISPDVASRLVDLGHDLGDFTTRVDMEAGLRYALGRMQYRLARRPPA